MKTMTQAQHMTHTERTAALDHAAALLRQLRDELVAARTITTSAAHALEAGAIALRLANGHQYDLGNEVVGKARMAAQSAKAGD